MNHRELLWDEDGKPTHFDGDTYEPQEDWHRLTAQLERVRGLMSDLKWRSLAEIEHATSHPQASISARLRDLRKEKFGAHEVEARRRGGKGGEWEYRVERPGTAQPRSSRRSLDDFEARLEAVESAIEDLTAEVHSIRCGRQNCPDCVRPRGEV